MKNISKSLAKVFSFAAIITSLFFYSHVAFAGMLTDFSYSATTFDTSATADYTFNYTVETADPNMIFSASFPSGFDLSNSGATVSINGTPTTVGEYWNGGLTSGGIPYIRLTDPTAPIGSVISVIISNIINPSTTGSYDFGWIYTGDSGGNEIDAPASIDSIVITAPVIPFSGSGSGTDMDPYLVTSCAQLIEVNNNLNKSYKLTTNLDCTANGNGIIIGSESTPFTGKFNGDNHSVIVSISTGSSINNVGLFSYLNEGELSNLAVSGTVSGGEYSSNIGMVAGFLYNSTAQGISSAGTVTSVGDNYTGGLFGQTQCGTNVTNSSSTANVTGTYTVGGITGRDSADGSCGGSISTYTNVHSTGNVSGLGSIGGVFGDVSRGIISDSYATGTITAENYGAGGFGGSIMTATVSNSYATGNVIGNENAGGFAGGSGCEAVFTRTYATGNVTGTSNLGGFSGTDGCEGPGSTISESFATGNVTGTNNNIGGFIGASFGTTITDAYATGNVSGDNTIGGFIGSAYYNGSMTNTYAKGTVTGTGAGGLIGSFDEDYAPTISHSFFDTTVSGLSDSNGGTPTITSLMKTQSTFTGAGWNFGEIWNINSLKNNGYPYFSWQTLEDDEVVTPPVVIVPVTPAVTGGTSGGVNLVMRAQWLAQQNKIPSTPTSVLQTNTCSASQILTQNLKPRSRNGIYSSYTKGIVKEVKILQAHLNRLGFSSGKEDGILGPISDGAIKRMQTFLKTKADGYVGPNTRAAINASCK